MVSDLQHDARNSNQAIWPIMILAHNEADHIVACLDSLYSAEPDRQFRIFVMANGCTDNTEDIVKAYSVKHPDVELVSIAMADKCNAWNVYIHQVIPEKVPGYSVYFFVDGDARVCPLALTELAKGLQENPEAKAASALPASGRSMQRDRQDMLAGNRLVANLYALSGEFVRHLQQKQVCIPLGLEGDDGLIGALVKWDLDPTQEHVKARIQPCEKAGFVFDSMTWTKLNDWKSYWRRMIRYARRAYEFELLGRQLKREGIEGMPTKISELYKGARDCKLRWSGIHTIFFWLALREMRKHVE